MSRQLNGHKVNPANDVIEIRVVDEPGSGGANHAYLVAGMSSLEHNPSLEALLSAVEGEDTGTVMAVLFQNGPIPDAGVNGLTHEVLLEILVDRLNGFQSGPFACQANQDCLDHLKAAQEILLNRTRERMARGVEGTHAK